MLPGAPWRQPRRGIPTRGRPTRPRVLVPGHPSKKTTSRSRPVIVVHGARYRRRTRREAAPREVPEITDKKLPTTTSDRQVEANRRNAQKSTGPRSATGKAASARNATRTGIYARSAEAIRRGPFAEDADDVNMFVDEVVNALQPRDALERDLALTIATTMLRRRRLDRVEVGEFHNAGRYLSGGDRGDCVDESGHRAELKRARAFRDFVAGGCKEYVDDDPAELLDWFGERLWPWYVGAGIEAWELDPVPETDLEWWRALAHEIETAWEDPDVPLAWAEEQVATARRQLRGNREMAEERAAARLIESLPKVVGVRSRNLRDLERLLETYDALRKRDIPDGESDEG